MHALLSLCLLLSSMMPRANGEPTTLRSHSGPASGWIAQRAGSIGTADLGHVLKRATVSLETPVCGVVTESAGHTQTVVTCPPGEILVSITKATWGVFDSTGCTCTGSTSTGTCTINHHPQGCCVSDFYYPYSSGSASCIPSGCFDGEISDVTFWPAVQECVGSNACQISNIDGCHVYYYDPCVGHVKRLQISAVCATASTSVSPTRTPELTPTPSTSDAPGLRYVCGNVAQGGGESQTIVSCPAGEVILAVKDAWYGVWDAAGCTCTGDSSSTGECTVTPRHGFPCNGCARFDPSQPNYRNGNYLSSGDLICVHSYQCQEPAVNIIDWPPVKACVGQQHCAIYNVRSCHVQAFDPCWNFEKYLFIGAKCGVPPSSSSSPVPVPAVVSLAAGPSAIVQGATTTLTATLNRVTATAVTVQLQFAGTATRNTDFTVSPNSVPPQIVIPAGQLSAAVTFTCTTSATQVHLTVYPNPTVIGGASLASDTPPSFGFTFSLAPLSSSPSATPTTSPSSTETGTPSASTTETGSPSLTRSVSTSRPPSASRTPTRSRTPSATRSHP